MLPTKIWQSNLNEIINCWANHRGANRNENFWRTSFKRSSNTPNDRYSHVHLRLSYIFKLNGEAHFALDWNKNTTLVQS